VSSDSSFRAAAATEEVPAAAVAHPAWRRVWWFYGIAFGGAVLVALLLWLVGPMVGSSATLVTQLGAALLYMPLPLVAALIVDRRDGRTPLLTTQWRRLRANFWPTVGRSVGYAVAVMVAVLGVGLAVSLAASALGVPGAGHLVGSDAEFTEHLRQMVPGATPETQLPGIAVVVGAGVLNGLLAGVTINALFAFGEEYGWRGFLADELRPLGAVRANLLTGLLWGLWHAPIIMLGHNYGADWAIGIPLMVAWTTPFSFLLWWVRARTGSVLAPAFLHGAFNGTVGFFALILIDTNPLVALPVGLLLAVALAVLAAVVWRLPTRSAA